MIKSPITEGKTKLIKSFKKEDIVKLYNVFEIDVSRFFKDDVINLFECEDTGYHFYHPFDIWGDGKFYEHFQQFDWYYDPWKWEHKEVQKRLKTDMKVLEVGCAKGDFLKKIQEDIKLDVVGLELNEKAAKIAQKDGLNVKAEMIEDHALNNKEVYDIACSFQVVEHIFDIKNFVGAQLECLKKGGILIISVPNMDGLMEHDLFNTLNLPPHHMGLWSEKSLTALADVFDMSLIEIIKEPLQSYHKNWFDKIQSHRVHLALKPVKIDKWPAALSWRTTKYLGKILGTFTPKKGHTIQAIYQKN